MGQRRVRDKEGEEKRTNKKRGSENVEGKYREKR